MQIFTPKIRLLFLYVAILRGIYYTIFTKILCPPVRSNPLPCEDSPMQVNSDGTCRRQVLRKRLNIGKEP